VQDVIHVIAGHAAGRHIGDRAFVESEALPLLRRHPPAHLFEVSGRTRREIIQPDNALIEPEQRLQQVRADEACHAGDQPGARLGGEFLPKKVVGGHKRGAGRNHEARARASRNSVTIFRGLWDTQKVANLARHE